MLKDLKMPMKGKEEEEGMGLEIEMEGMEPEMEGGESPLASFSDQELMDEAKARGLI
jgi:hypothetical protein